MVVPQRQMVLYLVAQFVWLLARYSQLSSGTGDVQPPYLFAVSPRGTGAALSRHAEVDVWLDGEDELEMACGVQALLANVQTVLATMQHQAQQLAISSDTKLEEAVRNVSHVWDGTIFDTQR